jgi:hypothetical protein
MMKESDKIHTWKGVLMSGNKDLTGLLLLLLLLSTMLLVAAGGRLMTAKGCGPSWLALPNRPAAPPSHTSASLTAA